MSHSTAIIGLLALVAFFMLYGRGVFAAAWAAAWASDPGGTTGAAPPANGYGASRGRA